MERVNHKVCRQCGDQFSKPPAITYKVFAGRRYCGISCARKGSGIARTIKRPDGWKRDRSREPSWSEWSLNPKSRLRFLRSKARGRAAEHGLAFDLAPEYLFSLWEETGGRCAITGRAFDLTPWGGKGDTNPNGPSIDRIEPSDGYVAGNVRLVVAHVNLALARYGEEALRQLCRDILGFGKDSDW